MSRSIPLPSRTILIDGGVGTELERRGYPMDPACWSARASIEAPELLFDVHRDYIAAGADVVCANTFMAAPHVLAAAGCADFEYVNREAVRLARRAREDCGRRDVLVAATMSVLPPLNAADDFPRGAEVARSYRRQAAVLADAGADILLAEMLIDATSASHLLEACCTTGLPVWAGASACTVAGVSTVMAFRQSGTLVDAVHQTLDTVLESAVRFPLAAAGIMHTGVDLMPAALAILDRHWRGPRLAYAKVGAAAAHRWRFDDNESTADYARHAGLWVCEHGVDIVGGCCGTRPAHLRALRAVIDAL